MQQATVNLLADMGVQPTALLQTLQPATLSTDTLRPVSKITSPAQGRAVQSNSVVTIVGTASDLGGVVGGVEVSTDGGETWHAASGRENWIYQWTPIAAGPVILQSRATDDSANMETALSRITVNVTPRQCPCSIWPPASAPTVAGHLDSASLEVGVKFFSDADGWVTGVRFFKASTNGGTHIGSLWTANGALLARATFAGESAAGWQQVKFAAPIAITAGTHYVASYHAPNGHYAGDHEYFLQGFDNPPLHALKSGADGGNGVYAYGTTPAFPSSSYEATNYWVDVVFTPKN